MSIFVRAFYIVVLYTLIIFFYNLFFFVSWLHF